MNIRFNYFIALKVCNKYLKSNYEHHSIMVTKYYEDNNKSDITLSKDKMQTFFTCQKHHCILN